MTKTMTVTIILIVLVTISTETIAKAIAEIDMPDYVHIPESKPEREYKIEKNDKNNDMYNELIIEFEDYGISINLL